MKKIIAILILSVYLISTTEFYQVLKFPLLLEHFSEHNLLNKDTTLWSFLLMHYTNNDVKYADYDKDMRLPFKSHEGSVHTLILSFLNNSVAIRINRPFDKELKVYKLQKETFFTSTFLSNIWQPPKSC